MSITAKLAATKIAALAFGAVVALASSQALANTKGPSGPQRAPGGQATQKSSNPYLGYHHKHHPVVNKQVCYWLPKISGGTVAGVEQKCYWTKI